MKRQLLHRLAIGTISLGAVAVSCGCSTRRGSADDAIVSLGALAGRSDGQWSLGAGDALGAELFACYVVFLERQGEPAERYAGETGPVLPE